MYIIKCTQHDALRCAIEVRYSTPPAKLSRAVRRCCARALLPATTTTTASAGTNLNTTKQL
ncbi:hypothetical protein TYRP_003066 [Tyrophagus putrescentiae]|nr:hypothetical protein TYRP_003066 [Tyrophagus putrescentiae]